MKAMDDTIRDFELEDLHASRRLRIGCPVYGHSYTLLKLMHATAPVTRQQENWPYFYTREQLGGYVGYTTAKPAPR
jgi:hypothetical protein